MIGQAVSLFQTPEKPDIGGRRPDGRFPEQRDDCEIPLDSFRCFPDRFTSVSSALRAHSPFKYFVCFPIRLLTISS